jgi:hypothetical protein
MGNLAFVGAHSINGVSALHTDLMKATVFRDLHRMYPERINNKTNGITPRRWLMQCNPGLYDLARETMGDGFMDDPRSPARPRGARRADPPSRTPSPASSGATRTASPSLVRERVGIRIDPNALFDIQIKRIHEYKRQLLNIIEAVALFDQIRSHPEKQLGAARQVLRRQGRAELPPRQADHQARQRRRARHQQRPGGARRAQGRLHAELQCQHRRDPRPGGGPLRADLDRRHGGLGHRQHEVRAQRRADHRHAGRGECRDPRAGRAPRTS